MEDNELKAQMEKTIDYLLSKKLKDLNKAEIKVAIEILPMTTDARFAYLKGMKSLMEIYD